MLKTFWRNESGATAIEYAFVAGLISILIVGGARAIGLNLNSSYYQKISTNLT